MGIEMDWGKKGIVGGIFEWLGYKVMKVEGVYFGGVSKKGLGGGEWG